MDRAELERKLEQAGVSPEIYSLYGGLPSERFVLDKRTDGRWEFYYSERGDKSGVRVFDLEAEATQYFLDCILRDPTVPRHSTAEGSGQAGRSSMSDWNGTITSALSRRFTKLAGVVHDLAAPLSEEQFWAKPFAFGNSFGHLVLHLTGNLNHYIGAQIAETGYVRDRPREFSETVRPSKAEVLKKFDDAVEMVVRTIRAQSAEDWSVAYSGTGADAQNRFEMVLQCATHLHHHIGQMMYLSFELKRNGDQGRGKK